MRFRTCRFWICFILILALSGCAEDPAETSCAHDLGRLIPAQSGSFFAEGTVAHYRCSLCDGLFDAMQNPVDTVATPKRSTELILTVNGAPVALKLTSQEAQLIRWETEPMDLAVGDTVSLTDADGEQLPFTAADAQRISDGSFRSPGLQAVLTLTATPDALVLSVSDGKYPGMVVQINGEEYPMAQADGSFIFGYARLSAGDQISITDNLTGDFYGYDHRSDDSLPEAQNYHRGNNGEFIIDADGRYCLALWGGNIHISKVFAPRSGDGFSIVFPEGGQPAEMECLPCPEGFSPAAFALEADTQNSEDIATFVRAEGSHVYSTVIHMAEGTRFSIENAAGTVPADRLTAVFGCTVTPTPEGCLTATEAGSYWIRYYPATDSISVTRLSSGGLTEAARVFDLRIAAIPSYAQADHAAQIKNLYAEYSTLPASFRWRLKITAKLETLHKNLQKAEAAPVVYHLATPNGSVYTDKDTLFRAFYTDFYYYIVAYHGTEQLKQYKIDNASDFLVLAKDFDGRDLPNLYAIGYIAGRYFLIYDTNGILDNQSDKGFLGFCRQNGLYEDLLPFLQRFFAYWRIDEGYANSTNPGADLFAEAWAPTVDIAKFFYYDENTTYVKTDRTVDCFANVACVAYGFDGSDPLPKLRLRGYVFEGWYTDADFTGEPLTALPEDSQSIHLYAKWSPDKAQQDKDSAALVDVYIYNLTTDRARVTASTVGYVRAMYDALSPEAKALVTQYEILKSFCARYSNN